MPSRMRKPSTSNMVTFSGRSSATRCLWRTNTAEMNGNGAKFVAWIRLDRPLRDLAPFGGVEGRKNRIARKLSIYTVQLNVGCIGKRLPIDLTAPRNDDFRGAAGIRKSPSLLESVE